MLVQQLRTLFAKDLAKLTTEVEQYKHEQNMWAIEGNIPNTAGNICLHLVGNLNTYIGGQLGNTGYVRDRDAEFALKNIARAEILEKISDTAKVVDDTLAALPNSLLNEEYPLVVFGGKITTGYFLIHLAMHLSYHLGQVNYHRRLLDK